MDFSSGLSLKIGETNFLFRIDGLCEFNTYGPSMHEFYLEETIKVKNWCFDYSWSTSTFCYEEIIDIRDYFIKLLSDEISEETWLNFLEPNYCFELYPKKKNYDVHVTFEISIREKSGAYTNETYEIYFHRPEIEKWIEYLNYVIIKYSRSI